MTDDKPSFYRHLSDNTKLLFAYHLYTNIRNLSGNIFLFDEPNNGFHATAQKELLRAYLKRDDSRGVEAVHLGDEKQPTVSNRSDRPKVGIVSKT